MENKYTVHIFWSDEDNGFIAICDEFSGLSAFGETREAALREAQNALHLMVEHYISTGQSLPEPKPIPVAA
jgi:predicted RNase H-like HicB family nuclease